MLASVCFDVEDLVTPESDDAAKWIASIMESVGLTGTFFLVGEKVRLLRERGREDVISHLKAHELGFHSTWHSVPPTVCAVCEDASFLGGVQRLMERERDGWELAEAILGTRLIGWATTGGSWTPSLCGLMHQFGGVQAYSPACFGEHSVVWYGNCLNFGQLIGGLDASFANDGDYANAIARFETALESALNSTRDWQGLFGGHPTRVISHEFWDGANFQGSANPPRDQWKRQPLRTPDEIDTAQRNFENFCKRLIADPRLRLVPLSEAARRFSSQSPGCSGSALLEVARRISDEERPVFTESFSTAELLVMMAYAVLLGRTDGAWFVRPTAFGPDAMPPESEPRRVPRTALTALASDVTASLADTGCIPATATVADLTLSAGQVLVAFARALLRPDAEHFDVSSVPSYPSVGDEIAERARSGIRGWRMHSESLDTTRIEEAARLQTWTLKPAWLRGKLPWEEHHHD